VAKAPPNLLQPLPQAPTASLAAELHLLSSFPGPLGPGSSRDKVGRLCSIPHAADCMLPGLPLLAAMQLWRQLFPGAAACC
jgi:hypothetical protein